MNTARRQGVMKTCFQRYDVILRRYLGLLAVLTLAWVPVVHTAQLGVVPDDLAGFARYKRFTSYDRYFTKYSKRFFGVGFDWHYFKAQAVAESNLRQDAQSPGRGGRRDAGHAAHLR